MADAKNVRQVAIDHHDSVVGTFEAYYRNLAQSRFTSAFTYGRAKLDRMIDDLFRSLPKGAAVLDVGCGTGEHLKRAQSHGLVATGLEPAPGMLKVARSSVPEARLKQGVATELPFEDEQFDAILQIEVLRYLHIDDIRKALRESRRVLKPGGIFFVTLVNRWALDGFYLRQRTRQWRKGSEFDETNPYCEFFTPATAEREFRNAGFIAVRSEGRLLAPLRLIYKASPALGRRLASGLEKLDDRIHHWKWTRNFAGHLIVTGRAPK